MSDQSTAELPLLPEDGIRRVLCVVAHPDDNEYGISAAVARWVDHGAEVAYLLLTAGEAGMPTPPEETAPVRAAEQRAACDAVGVGELTILNHPDGMLVYGLDLRRDIAREIRRFKPDTVVVSTWAEQPSWGLNQADHRAVGLAAMDAIRDADNPWVFRDLAEQEGLAKWKTSRLLIFGDADPTHGVDVSGDPLRRGIASLRAHETYLAALSDHADPGEFLPQMTADAGSRVGVANAVLFAVHEM